MLHVDRIRQGLIITLTRYCSFINMINLRFVIIPHLNAAFCQVYPYSYMSSFDKFEEKELPPIEAFTNDLTGEKCSEDDYSHVCKIWRAFNLQSLKDLCELYVKSDTLQLDAVFQAYRQQSLQSFQIDSIHFFTAPG